MEGEIRHNLNASRSTGSHEKPSLADVNSYIGSVFFRRGACYATAATQLSSVCIASYPTREIRRK